MELWLEEEVWLGREVQLEVDVEVGKLEEMERPDGEGWWQAWGSQSALPLDLLP